jgi:hypothetical protein
MDARIRSSVFWARSQLDDTMLTMQPLIQA